MAHNYVHGYSEREQMRLFDQASTLYHRRRWRVLLV